ncbi:MAG: cytochrome C551 [Spirochaetales bacterium]|jgi:hypothetical protein|nr:cytochrome C551 [Spirochaetales bacterium]
MSDKKIICKDCGKDFMFTESEQEFYIEKGFDNEPQRCKACRKAKKDKRGGSDGRGGGSGKRKSW